jgi:hypothetical protein
VASDSFEVESLRVDIQLVAHVVPTTDKLLLVNELRFDKLNERQDDLEYYFFLVD